MTLQVAVIGTGNWGRNLVRVFGSLPRCSLRWVCDRDARLVAEVPAPRPTRRTRDVNAVLGDPQLDAIVVATPPRTHAPLALRALSVGKHVLVEKPMALSSKDAIELRAAARRAARRLMVGHILQYHPAVLELREQIRRGVLGRVRYVLSERLTLPGRSREENAWWALAPHDISVASFLLDSEPESVRVQDRSDGVREEVVLARLRFGDGAIVLLHASCCHSVKTRRLTVVGTRHIACFDDGGRRGTLRFFRTPRHFTPSPAGAGSNWRFEVTDATELRVPRAEPLRLEASHFVDAVLDGRPIRTDVENGVMVVRALEAGSDSLRCSGETKLIVAGHSPARALGRA